MAMYLLQKANGEFALTNNTDDRPMLVASKAHGYRVIRWLGLQNITLVRATKEQEASSCMVEMHRYKEGWLGTRNLRQ